MSWTIDRTYEPRPRDPFRPVPKPFTPEKPRREFDPRPRVYDPTVGAYLLVEAEPQHMWTLVDERKRVVCRYGLCGRSEAEAEARRRGLFLT